MVRFSSKFLAIVAAVAVVVMAAQLAVAQNEKGGRRDRGGRGGSPGGPPSMARLATIDEVQDALKLTDEQKAKIEKINSESRKEMAEASKGDRPDPKKMRQMRDGVTDKMSKVLDADQQKRLMGIFVQVAGAGAVLDPAVAKELNITDEQKDKLREAMGGMREGRGEARGPAKREGKAKGEGKGEGDQGSYRERREKMEKAVMAVLTSEQQKKLEELKGEKVDVDMSKLRGPGGGGRPDRERGKRGEAKENKSS